MNYVNIIEKTTKKQDIKSSITTLKLYKAIMLDSSVDKKIKEQKNRYNQEIEKEIKENMLTLRKTKQTYSNIEIYRNLTSKNNDLKNCLFTEVANQSIINKITAENKKYIAVKSKIIKRQKEKERKQQEYYNRHHYNGHIIYTGPRGGRYYINRYGNKVYIKY